MRKLPFIKPDKYRTSAMNPRVRFVRILPLLLIVLACIAIVVSAQQKEEESIAVVIRINGSLEYREAAGEEWKSAKKGQHLYNGNQLRTAIGNRAIIVYTSGTRILVNENTELEITAQVPGKFQKPTSERTKLLIGEVFSRVKPDRERQYQYEVETPSSVASVRGTDFDAKYEEGEAIFLVISEVVEVMNQLGKVLLEEMQTTTVPEGQAPEDPVTLSKSAAEKLVEWTKEIEATWKLNLVPQGGTTQEISKAFTLTIWAQSAETNMIDVNASFGLTSFTATSDALEFSTDTGKTWTGPPDIILTNGQANLMVRGNAVETVTISAEAEECEPASLGITIAKAREKKTIEMNFANPDGTGEETLLFEFEEK